MVGVVESGKSRTLPSKLAGTLALPQMTSSAAVSPVVRFDPRRLSLLLTDIWLLKKITTNARNAQINAEVNAGRGIDAN